MPILARAQTLAAGGVRFDAARPTPDCWQASVCSFFLAGEPGLTFTAKLSTARSRSIRFSSDSFYGVQLTEEVEQWRSNRSRNRVAGLSRVGMQTGKCS